MSSLTFKDIFKKAKVEMIQYNGLNYGNSIVTINEPYR